ncbi:MAG: carboxymuconolactone decarboxylase family protein [Gemmataceae bacterium]|nr:carboxymuconolactone decarboxylase family protein [Gemmataceae bacterium]MDW8264323.1 carboxymuconolactone decarboxylase family protein [Gemmataceae bacterium]
MPELPTPALDALKETLPDTARDLKLNLGSVLGNESLTAEQTWGVALAAAYFIGEPRLRDALLTDARAAAVGEAVMEDAQAAAALMGMNTVYYRFRHLVGKPSYGQRPSRLRMQWMAKPKTSKATFELCCLAVAVLAGCEMCIKSHEASLLKEGITEEQVHDTVRIAAVLQGVCVGLALA